jgi:hypothetical protein
MEGYMRVEGHNHLYRDKKTGAIVNMDSTGYKQYKRQKLKRQIDKNDIASMKSQLDESRKQIEELKELIQEMINRK